MVTAAKQLYTEELVYNRRKHVHQHKDTKKLEQ